MSANAAADDERRGTIVFLFGAGCSADCGAPTMQQFMRKARQYEREPDNKYRDAYQAMFRYRENCLKMSYIFDRWWDNIEHLYTQAHLRTLIDVEGADRLREWMELAIWDVYRRPAAGEGGGYKRFAIFLRDLRSSSESPPRPVIITTNYDIHLEATLKSGATGTVQVAYPGQDRMIMKPADGADATGRLGEARVEIAKLHGSSNWFESDGKTTCDWEMAAPLSNGYALFCCQKDDFDLRQSSPLIVPPLLGKVKLPDIIAAQWKHAVESLKTARLVVVAGYSFPETDMFMTRLLAEGIRENTGLERFIIVNSDGSPEWRERVGRLFSRSWAENCVDWCFSDFAKFSLSLKEGSNLFFDDEKRQKDEQRYNHTDAVKLLREFVGR